ncbi:MAG: hypothetical protein ACK41T_03710 [Pseudobdellovibrio sp.]
MKFKSLTTALIKHGLELTTNGNQYYAIGVEYSVSFYKQDDRAVAVYVTPNDDKDDLYTDYHCGFFPKTIKRIFEYVKAA